jgi:putative nucleotidyltransferase with HDIG domain
MSRRNNHSLRSEALHNLQVAKRWTRLFVYPGVTLLIPIDIFVLHFPLLQSVLSHVGGYVVAALGIELGYNWGERVRQQAEYPNVLRTQLGSPANVRDACYAAAGTLVELLRADAAVLVLFHRDTYTPEVLVSHGVPPGVLKFNAEQAPLIQPFLRCAETRSILIEPLQASHPFFSAFEPGRCRVYVPIVSMDKVVGVISIIGPRRRPELKDRTLLKALGGALGLLLDNVRLYGHEHQAMLHILTSALDQRDRVTEGHSRRVTELSLIVARELGIEGDELLDIERAAILHDIGKLAVPDAILSKPGPLTPDEWVEMRRHPDVGYKMVRDVPFLSRAAEIIRSHHERFDGAGYPRNLRGEEIPVGARIFAVVDAYDAMTSDRPYRLALSHEEALAEIRRQAGTQFDPVVVVPFFAAVRKGLIGPGMQIKGQERLFRMPGGNGPTPSPEATHVPASR